MVALGKGSARGHAELVENSLPRRRIAIAVACNTSLDVVVVDLRVQHCFHTSLIAHFGVAPLGAWLDEFGQADAQHVRRDVVLGRHSCDVLRFPAFPMLSD